MALSRLAKHVVLDIDGVLLKGGTVINGAASAIQKLADAKIPYVFVTNGGGMKEEQKARDLKKKLGIEVLPEQVILSHTPFKNLKDTHENSKVLIVGGQPRCLDVARSYGFRNACTIESIHAENPGIYCLHEAHDPDSVSHDKDAPVEAVMVFHDPVNWGLEMQVLCDVLSPHHVNTVDTPSNKQRGHIPFYVSNADVVYATDYPHPRFTQGAFVTAFQHLYQTYHNQPLQVDYCGKPYNIQYEYATQVLQQEAQRIGVHSSDTANTATAMYFGVGDNPKSDIRGANAAGPHWRSVLVRTGLFNDRNASNDSIDPAHYVCEDIVEAVQTIIDYKH